MDIITKILELKIGDTLISYLKDGTLFSKNIKAIADAKSDLRSRCGVVFVNIMGNTNSKCIVMIKTTNQSTIVYEYDKRTEELTIKGERKNVNTK